MILQRVTYHVFEHELAASSVTNIAACHVLDGEIELTFSGGKTMFVSWGNGSLQYCIEQKKDSFFNAAALKTVDVTHHPYWRPLVEREIAMSYIDDAHQVLALASGQDSLFLSSQYHDGTFFGDCVRVSRENPL